MLKEPDKADPRTGLLLLFVELWNSIFERIPYRTPKGILVENSILLGP